MPASAWFVIVVWAGPTFVGILLFIWSECRGSGVDTYTRQRVEAARGPQPSNRAAASQLVRVTTDVARTIVIKGLLIWIISAILLFGYLNLAYLFFVLCMLFIGERFSLPIAPILLAATVLIAALVRVGIYRPMPDNILLGLAVRIACPLLRTTTNNLRRKLLLTGVCTSATLVIWWLLFSVVDSSTRPQPISVDAGRFTRLKQGSRYPNVHIGIGLSG
jgi:hypothetical protein